jgi:hypothetical protein
MIVQASKHGSEPSLRIDVIELGRVDGADRRDAGTAVTTVPAKMTCSRCWTLSKLPDCPSWVRQWRLTVSHEDRRFP